MRLRENQTLRTITYPFMTSIDNKVQSLADKIYADGVEKAKKEAEEILNSAQTQKEKILKQAKEEADAILQQAQQDAVKEKETATAEIVMAARRAIDSLKSEMAGILNDSAISAGVAAAAGTPDKIYNLIVEMVKAWSAKGNMEISTADADALQAYFASHAQETLNKGVSIKSINGKPHSFELKPEGQGYKMVIGQEELEAYFREFFRPRLRAILFPEKA